MKHGSGCIMQWKKFTFQQGNNCKHAGGATSERNQLINILLQFSQNLTENL